MKRHPFALRFFSRKGGKTLLLLALLLTPFWYLQELQIREEYAYAGVPQAQSFGEQSLSRVFRNQGFMLGYSETRRNPLWVIYRLGAERRLNVGKRPEHFRVDDRTLSRVTQEDYQGSGYDRGHLAPNYAMARQYGREAQLDSFLMTNITPQTKRLNQKLWQRLEEVEIDRFTQWFQELWVITGPIFDDQISRLPSGIEIPDAFYKIYAIPGEKPRLLAFIVPQTVGGRESLDQFLASVDEVESLTGLDFFHQLEDGMEAQLESTIDTTGWRLQEVANLPPRY